MAVSPSRLSALDDRISRAATGRGSTLVVETDHLEPATLTNNGLDHSREYQASLNASA